MKRKTLTGILLFLLMALYSLASVIYGLGGPISEKKPLDMLVKDKFAYVLYQDSFQIIDVSNPAAPKLLSKTINSGVDMNWGMAISGQFLFVTVQLHGFEVFDVSNPRFPSFRFAYDCNPKAINVKDNALYIRDYTDGFLIFDISKPQKPVLKYTNHNYKDFDTYHFFFTGDFMYIPTAESGIRVYDTTDPMNPKFLHAIKPPIAQQIYSDACVYGKYMYVTFNYNEKSLAIIDIADPKNPKFISYLEPESIVPSGIEINNGCLYVSDSYKGIAVYDLHNPGNPVLLKLISCKSQAKFKIANGCLFLAEMSKGFRVIEDRPDGITQVLGAAEKDLNGIVFCSKCAGRSYIYLSDSEFRIQKQLDESAGVNESPRSSPDGTRIVFISNRDGNKQIYCMNSDGSDRKRLTRDDADDESPVWSPDGKTILFVTDRDGNREVYKIDLDTGDETRLTDNPEDDIAPAWSPDGQKIVYTAFHDKRAQIWMMNREGDSKTCLAQEGASPAWSPDSQKIAFVVNSDNGESRIYLMNTDGSQRIKISDKEGNNLSPVFSPDGSKLIFLSKLPEGDTIYLSDIKKIKPHELVFGTNIEGICFTGDGKKVFYGFESPIKNWEKDIGVYNLILNKTTYSANNWGDTYNPAPVALSAE